ncbi:MAG TPA: M48 family metallopeptidase [Burkholderiaceae bacterium]|nr:M48 family metallopeptidase [Burkholderiaceae bacterium]
MAMRFRDQQDAARQATRRLLLLFGVVLVLLVLAVNGALALIYRAVFPWLPGYPAFFFETNTGLVLLFVLGGCWFESLRLREGGAHVARLAGGRAISGEGASPRDLYEKRLLNVVAEMAIASRVKMPGVYVLPREEAINAFAAGWTEGDAVIAVTRGALTQLTREELQGVVAHEFSHIGHGDMRLNMRLIGLVWGLQMVYTFGRSLVEPDEAGRRPAGLPFGLALMAVGSMGWVAGRMLKAAVSRQREFLADASAVQYTRSVEGIGGALRKIADQLRRAQDRWVSAQAESLSHLFFFSRAGWLFATHPPLGERIRRIYGRQEEALPAMPLPPPPDEATHAAFAPGAATRGGRDLPPLRAAAGETVEGGAPQGLRDDPVQRAAAAAQVERDREVLGRIARWHGPGERKAAVLALLAGEDERAWVAWERETTGLAVAQSVRAQVQGLGPAARLPALELLLRRTAAAPVEERRALVEAARRVMQADGQVDPGERLRWMLLRHLLAGPHPPPPPSSDDNHIAHLSKEVAVWTAFLGRIVAAPGWYEGVLRDLLPEERRPASVPADGQALLEAWQSLGRLAAMQRPVLVRAWVEAARREAGGAALPPAWADALRISACLLDTPSPQALVRQYIEAER